MMYSLVSTNGIRNLWLDIPTMKVKLLHCHTSGHFFYTLKRTLFRFLCWKQRHGQPNKEINSCNYIQMAMLTFAAESPRSLWLSGSWHCDSNVTLHNKWTQKQRQNCFAFRSPCKVHASPLSGRQDKSRPKPKKFKWTQFQLVQAVEACFAM